jgi:hypothetical protein
VLNLGHVKPGQTRRARVVLRNRGWRHMHVRVDASGLPDGVAVSYKEACLPPGIPRVIDVSVQLGPRKETLGELRVVCTSIGEDGRSREEEARVPMYACRGAAQDAKHLLKSLSAIKPHSITRRLLHRSPSGALHHSGSVLACQLADV